MKDIFACDPLVLILRNPFLSADFALSSNGNDRAYFLSWLKIAL